MSDRLATASARDLRALREEEWRRLERIVVRAERKSPRALSDEDLMELPVLYRGALSSLSVARETSLDLELVTYLEGLCARAYFFVYGVRTSPWRRFGLFFARDWPAAVRSLWRETLVAAGLMVVGMVVGYLLVAADPIWYDSLVPNEMAGGRDFNATTESLRRTLYDTHGVSALSIFATFLFTHNSQISILAFALGFAFGVPTILLLIINGGIAGAMFALFAKHGLGVPFAGWIIIHGSTELFAITLAGAAGLRIGWSVVFPGENSRLLSATQSGKMAGVAMAGVIVMLMVAGLLEGLGRQLILMDAMRYGIGLTMLLFWLAFFYLPRGERYG
jgi:uncharacterized membrane protein SpoIIM required for sporulation